MKKILTCVGFGLLLAAQSSFAQDNSYCKTGSDADLSVLKQKIQSMAAHIAQQKKIRTDLRAQLEPLKDEILSLDKQIKPLRDKHQKASRKSQKSAKSYAKYKSKWLDSGELERLNGMIKTRKAKYSRYQQMLSQYRAADNAFQTSASRYRYIARDLLDKNRDCAAARAALQ